MQHAIVVPGNGYRRRGDVYRLSRRCVAALRISAQLAERERPRVVVFTGWSPHGGPSEAELMLEAWSGRRDVELVAETSASITAENMCRALPLLIERRVTDATIVCGLLHLPRVRYFFGGVYPQYGIRCRYRLVGQAPTPRALVWEAGALPLARGQRDAAIRELRVR